MNEDPKITLKCQICKETFENIYFDKEQGKCILHSDKNEESGWQISDTSKVIWNPNKVNLFWRYIQIQLDNLFNNASIDNDSISWEYKYYRVVFPQFQKEVMYNPYANNLDEMGKNFHSYGIYENLEYGSTYDVNKIFEKFKITFHECTFLDIANFKKYSFKQSIIFKKCKFYNKILFSKHFINSLDFNRCNFYNNELDVKNSNFEKYFSIKNCTNIKKASFYNSTFKDEVRFQNCIIQEYTNFNKTRFKKLADFHNSVFMNVNFTNTIFEDIVIFSNTIFKENINFNYTIFEKLAIFRDSHFEKKLNLRDAIFKSDANFLDIKANMANRETARIIKYQLQKIGNIIDSNRFHSLELSEQRKVLLTISKPSFKRLQDGLIFFIHFISSNHSTSWFLVFFWIIITGLLTGLGLEKYNTINFNFMTDTIKYISIIHFDENMKKNPIILFLNKALLGYLYYQFLTTIRKDTRSS